MDTVEPTVPLTPPTAGTSTPGEPLTAAPRTGWWRRHPWLGALLLAAVAGVVLAGLFWRLPYYMLSPGHVRDTAQHIRIEGAPSYPPGEGDIDFLTVSIRQATPFELIGAWFDPAVEVVEAEQVLGDQTPAENRQLNLRLMADSKDAATYQALSRLGYDIPTRGTGAVIATVESTVPAASVLAPADVVVSFDGQPIGINQELIDAVTSKSPGDVVQVGLQALDGGEARTVEVTLAARPDDPSTAMLGVSTFTRDLSFDFPVDVTIDSGRVGGPSAGLAFTLGVLEAMTPESLTGGARVATTGTMRLDGTVGPVGGVHQKVVAARRADVDVMLVPAVELDEARAAAGGDLRVEPVEDLDDALEVLTTLGGGNDVLPAPSTAALPS